MDTNWKDSIPSRIYEVIYADFPWSYLGQVQHGGKGAKFTSGAHCYYPTMKPDEIYSFPIKSMSEKNSILYLWVTGPQVEIAMNAIRAWEFRFKTIGFCWDKVLVNPGAYTMSQFEYVFVATRGAIPKPRGTRNERQYFREKRTRHSAKPAEIRESIERMHPTQTKIELFARGGAVGWDLYGKEAYYVKDGK